jgi:hypothetical protein
VKSTPYAYGAFAELTCPDGRTIVWLLAYKVNQFLIQRTDNPKFLLLFHL